MDSVKEMVLTVCVLSIITGIIHTIKPSGKYDRQIGLITACLMLVGVLAPVYDGLRSIDTDISTASAEDNAASLTEAADEELLSLAEEELEAALRQALADEGIPSSRIEVEMNTCDDMSIDISRVTVVSTRPELAETEVRRFLGEDVEVHAKSSY